MFKSWTLAIRTTYPRVSISFQQFIRTLGPIPTSKTGTKHFRNIYIATLVRAHIHAHTHTRIHAHIHTHDCFRHSSRNRHHSTSSRVNSNISQYCSLILNNECCTWPAPSFSESTFTLDLECIAIYLILIPIGVSSKLALDTNNWIMESLLSSHDS